MEQWARAVALWPRPSPAASAGGWVVEQVSCMSYFSDISELRIYSHLVPPCGDAVVHLCDISGSWCCQGQWVCCCCPSLRCSHCPLLPFYPAPVGAFSPRPAARHPGNGNVLETAPPELPARCWGWGETSPEPERLARLGRNHKHL